MATSTDKKLQDAAVEKEEGLSTQLLKDLEDRLVTLEDKMELSNAVLRDLMELRRVLEDKNLSDGPFPDQK